MTVPHMQVGGEKNVQLAIKEKKRCNVEEKQVGVCGVIKLSTCKGWLLIPHHFLFL